MKSTNEVIEAVRSGTESWYADNPTPSRLGEALRQKSRDLRDDMRELVSSGAFYRTKALKKLREACADLARLDDTDLDARIERVDMWLDRYQCSRPDWEEGAQSGALLHGYGSAGTR